MKQQPIQIAEGKRPLLYVFLSAPAFSLALFFLIIFFFGVNLLKPDLSYPKFQTTFLYVTIILIPIGILYGRTRNVYLDFETNRLREEWQLGPFRYGKWEDLEPIDFVNVFRPKKVSGPEMYEINLWFKSKRRKELFELSDKNEAIQLAQTIAKKLRRDFKDSSDPHNPKWTAYYSLS